MALTGLPGLKNWLSEFSNLTGKITSLRIQFVDRRSAPLKLRFLAPDRGNNLIFRKKFADNEHFPNFGSMKMTVEYSALWWWHGVEAQC